MKNILPLVILFSATAQANPPKVIKCTESNASKIFASMTLTQYQGDLHLLEYSNIQYNVKKEIITYQYSSNAAQTLFKCKFDDISKKIFSCYEVTKNNKIGGIVVRSMRGVHPAIGVVTNFRVVDYSKDSDGVVISDRDFNTNFCSVSKL